MVPPSGANYYMQLIVNIWVTDFLPLNLVMVVLFYFLKIIGILPSIRMQELLPSLIPPPNNTIKENQTQYKN